MAGYFTPETDPRLFRCQCGRAECDAPATLASALLAMLNELRARVGRPIVVTSGNRCAWWNRQQGGEDDGDDRRYTDDDSEHCDPAGATGADLLIRSGRERWKLLEANFRRPVLFRRLGIGPDFLHVGTSIIHAGEVTWTYYAKPRAT